MANRMSTLLDKIERRLGTKPLNLPDHLKKDQWSEVISNETLDTFSRYFPHIIRINLELASATRKNGYFLLDEYIPDNVDILGVKDINWTDFSKDSASLMGTYGMGMYNWLQDYSLDSVLMLQARADTTSLFNNGIYIDFKPPNMVKFTSVTGFDIAQGTNAIPLDVLIKHPDNLMTISPTAMEVFEALAQADIARFLYSNLKYYDGLETVFANIDLKINDLESEANRRDDIVQQLRDGYVSAANTNQPMILSI